MANTKFTATYNGKVIGSRKSPRPYQFAIVIQHDIERARDRAHLYAATATDRSNFEYETAIAGATPNVEFHHPGREGARAWSTKYSAEQIERAKAKIDGGFDAYVARLRADMIERFETRVAAGHFEPCVHGWSMSHANAQKMANSVGGVLLAIVPAVVS